MPSRKLLLFLGALSVSCGHKTPAGPDPVPPAPSVSCPADIALVSHQGQPQPTASFDTPAAQDGQAPVTVVCKPPSGSEFANGTTTVQCTATDSLSRTGSCSFSVIVTPVPHLEKTRFLAFGDSITEGKVTLRAPTIFTVPPGTFNVPGSYPDLLDAKLSSRYQDQTVTVIADGWGGEQTGDGKNRLKIDLPAFNPDVLLLMEGTNDMLFASDPAGITSAADALQNMTQQGKSRGVRVLIATLLPIDPAKRGSAAAEGVNTLNGRIKTMATAENVTLVDLNAVVPLSLIGYDGVHPIPSAYQVISDEWLKAIEATLEVKTP